MKEKLIRETVIELIKKAETSLPRDVEKKLEKAYQKESYQLAKIQLGEILENIKVARKKSLPLCQDTGLLTFYVTLGEKIKIKPSQIKKAIKEALKIATEKIPLRENTVNPLTRKNFGNNLGKKQPEIHFSFSENNFLEVTTLIKGAGSENFSSLTMLNPNEGKKGIKKIILEKVKEAGGKPCSPIILGIGIGGSANQALEISKKALLRPLGKKNKNKEIAKLEEEILSEVNELGIGVMGLGKGITCLGVNIQTAATHTASLPLAINFGCWATRRAGMRI